MAMQNVGPIAMPKVPLAVSAAPSFATMTIDAAGEKAAFVFPAPKTGNITSVIWRTGTVTTGATSSGIDVRIETVDTATGDPSGTLFGTNTNAAQIVQDTDDNTSFETTLTAAAAVTKDDMLAVVLARGDSANMQIAMFADETLRFPYADLFTAAWAKDSQSPVVGVVYDDGSTAYMPGCWPIDVITTTTFSSSSTPDVVALRFQLLVPSRCCGFWLWADLDGDATVKLYDSDGVTVLASASLDKDIRSGATAGIFYRPFATAVSLSKDTFYWLGVEPGASNMSVYDFSVAASYTMDVFEGGDDFHLSTAKDPTGTGSWTNTTTKRPFMGVLLDQFSDGVGSGSTAFVIGE